MALSKKLNTFSLNENPSLSYYFFLEVNKIISRVRFKGILAFIDKVKLAQ